MKLGTRLLFRLLVTVAAVMSLFESFHLRVLRRPAEGVRVGTLFLAQLFERSTGRLPAALGAYTAGPRRPPRWREQRSIATRTSSPNASLSRRPGNTLRSCARRRGSGRCCTGARH